MHILGRFPYVRSDHNARVFRTGSGQNGPAYGSEPLSPPAPVDQSAGIWRVLAGKLYARTLGLSISAGQNLFCFVRPNRKRPYIFSLCDIFTKSVFTLAMPSQRKRKHSRKINKYKCECNLTRTQEKGKFPFSCALVAPASQISKREWR